MTRWITNAKLIALAGFFVASLAAVAYQMVFVWPVQRCEAHGAWWDGSDRQCLTPIAIWRITGRPLASGPVAGDPQGQADLKPSRPTP
ncbi:MAG TPA: hypothetical protein VII73_02345 [Caulobacteraceae bacterium]